MERGLLQDFISRSRAVENQQRSSGHLLSSFQRNLELFRRPPLQNSGVLEEIFKRNQTTRLTSYIEAGCRHTSTDKRIVVELNESIRSLQDHVKKIDTCLEELEKVLDSATTRMLDSSDARIECHEPANSHEQETCGTPDHSLREEMDNITNMALIHTMLQRDHEMQAKVVDDLRLDMSLETLQSYHTMWTLRPFVNEKWMTAILQS